MNYTNLVLNDYIKKTANNLRFGQKNPNIFMRDIDSQKLPTTEGITKPAEEENILPNGNLPNTETPQIYPNDLPKNPRRKIMSSGPGDYVMPQHQNKFGINNNAVMAQRGGYLKLHRQGGRIIQTWQY